MQIGKTRDPNIYLVIGKVKNEDSIGLRRLCKGRNFVPKFQDILQWSKHLNKRRKMTFQLKTHSEVPKRIERGPQKVAESAQAHTRRCQAPGVARHMRLAHGLGAQHLVACGKSCFLWFFRPWNPMGLALVRWKFPCN